MKKIKCPHCGYIMPLTYKESSSCRGVYVKCKGRKCGQIFEIRLPEKEIK